LSLLRCYDKLDSVWAVVVVVVGVGVGVGVGVANRLKNLKLIDSCFGLDLKI
jgi:hypothetical protein